MLTAGITSIANVAFSTMSLTQAHSIEQALVTRLTTITQKSYPRHTQEIHIITVLMQIYQNCTMPSDPVKLGTALNEAFITAINNTSRKCFLDALASYIAKFQNMQSQNVPIFKDIDDNFSTASKMLSDKQHVAETEPVFINTLIATTNLKDATLFCDSLNTCLSTACSLYHDTPPLNATQVYPALNAVLTKATNIAKAMPSSTSLPLVNVIEYYLTEFQKMPTLRNLEKNTPPIVTTLAFLKNELSLIAKINKVATLTPAITFWNDWSTTNGDITNTSLDTAYTTYQKEEPANAPAVYTTLNDFFVKALSYATTPDHYTALETYIKKFQSIPTLKATADGFTTLAKTCNESSLTAALTAATAVIDDKTFFDNWSATSALLDTVATSYKTVQPINTSTLYTALHNLLTKALNETPLSMLPRLSTFITTFHELPIFKGSGKYNFADITKLYKAKLSEQNLIDKLTRATHYTELCGLLDKALTKTIFADDDLFNAVATAIYRTIDLITPYNYTTYQSDIDNYIAQATTKFNNDFATLRESLLDTTLIAAAQVTDHNAFWKNWNSTTTNNTPKLLESLYMTCVNNTTYNPIDTYNALETFFTQALGTATTHNQFSELSTHISKFRQMPALAAIKNGFATIDATVQKKSAASETEENLIASLTTIKTFPELIQLLTQATSLQETYAPQKLATAFSSAFATALTTATNTQDTRTLKTILDRALNVSFIANNLKTLTTAFVDKQQAITTEESLIANLAIKTTIIEIFPLLQHATRIKKPYNAPKLAAAFAAALNLAITTADNTTDLTTIRAILTAATNREYLNINHDALTTEVTARYKAIASEEKLIAALSSKNIRPNKIKLLKQALNAPNHYNTTKLARAFVAAFKAALTTATDADIIALQGVLAAAQHAKYLSLSIPLLTTTFTQRQQIHEAEALLISKLANSTTLTDLYTYLAPAVAPSLVINAPELAATVATALNKAVALVTEENYTTEQPKVARYITAAQSKFLDIKKLPAVSSTPDRIFIENYNNLDAACNSLIRALNQAQGAVSKLPSSARTPSNITYVYSSVALNKALSRLNQALSALQKTPHAVLASCSSNPPVKKACTHIINSLSATISALAEDPNIVYGTMQALNLSLLEATLQNMQQWDSYRQESL
jgi:hypothetical protein